jgi:hypothetical protein
MNDKTDQLCGKPRMNAGRHPRSIALPVVRACASGAERRARPHQQPGDDRHRHGRRESDAAPVLQSKHRDQERAQRVTS